MRVEGFRRYLTLRRHDCDVRMLLYREPTSLNDAAITWAIATCPGVGAVTPIDIGASSEPGRQRRR